MRKTFYSYLSLWAILVALFVVIALVSPGWEAYEKYSPSFWLGGALIIICFIANLVCAIFAFKPKNLGKVFLRLSILSISFSALVASFIVGGLCMLISPLTLWVGVIICAIILAIDALSVAKCALAVTAVGKLDDKVKVSTSFIKALSVEAKSLISLASSDELRAETKKVYEAIYYSDSVSSPEIEGENQKISKQFEEFSCAVRDEDIELARAHARTLVAMADARNQKCKLYK